MSDLKPLIGPQMRRRIIDKLMDGNMTIAAASAPLVIDAINTLYPQPVPAESEQLPRG